MADRPADRPKTDHKWLNWTSDFGKWERHNSRPEWRKYNSFLVWTWKEQNVVGSNFYFIWWQKSKKTATKSVVDFYATQREFSSVKQRQMNGSHICAVSHFVRQLRKWFTAKVTNQKAWFCFSFYYVSFSFNFNLICLAYLCIEHFIAH